MSIDKKKPRAAGTYNHSFTPYFGQFYFPSQQVKAMYPEIDVAYTSPAFTQNEQAFTSQEQMMDFIHELSTHNHVRLEIIGHSLEGREVPMLVFTTSEEHSEAFNSKPTVWLQAQVHGNEPAAGESALIIADELANGQLGEDVLDDINVIIIPRMNPDSGYYFERNSVTQLNGNRDHVNLEMPELQAIHRVFNDYNPEVVIDAHEYGAFLQYEDFGEQGSIKYHDVLLLSGKNLNIPKEIRKKADEWFIDNPFKELEKKGYSYGNYYTVSSAKAPKPTLLEGGVDAGTGRNAFALKPSFSILVETLGIGIGRENFLRRVDGQVVTHTSILKTVVNHAEEVKKTIQQAREYIVETGNKGQDNGTVVLQSKRKKVGDQIAKAIDIAKGEVIDIPVTYYSATDSIPTLERKRPNAYMLPPAYHEIVNKLKNQGAAVEKLTESQTLEVECFEVVEREVNNQGDRPLSQLTTKIKTEQRYFEKGSYVIRSAQPTAYLVSLSLEPESGDSYFTYNFFPTHMNGELPVYRYMSTIDFPLEDV